MAASPAALPVLEVHTPQSSFAVVHSCKACSSPFSAETEPAHSTRGHITESARQTAEESWRRVYWLYGRSRVGQVRVEQLLLGS